MRNLALMLIILFLTSCKLFKRPSGGGGFGGPMTGTNMASWLNDNVPTRNSCIGIEVDPLPSDVHIAPAKINWKDEWTESLYKDLEKAPYNNILKEGVLTDKTWEKLGCPNYKNIYDKQRRAVWITFIAQLARYESGFDTRTSGDGGISNGLLQMDYHTVSKSPYSCKFSGYGNGHMRRNEKENLRCGLLVLNWNFRAKHLCDGRVPCAGGISVTGKPHGYFGVLEGGFWHGSKHRQFTESMRSHIAKNFPFCKVQKGESDELTKDVKEMLGPQGSIDRLGEKSKNNECTQIANGDREPKPVDDTQNDIYIPGNNDNHDQGSSQK